MSSVVRNFIVTFIVSLIIFAVISYAIVNNVSSFFPQSEEETDSSSVTAASPSETDEAGNPITTEFTEETTPASSSGVDDSFTMLLVGTDYQPDILTDYDASALNEGNTGFPVQARKVQADSILLLRADRNKGVFVFTSLPSDMAVTVEGSSMPLGELYSEKGVTFFCEMVRAMTGLTVDYYAVASVEDLAEIIDSVGGITYTVPTNMNYTDESQELEIKLSKGSQTLDGITAVNMLRYKGYSDGDVSRRALAVQFAKALLKKLATPDNLTVAANLYTDLTQYVETNFTLTDLTRHLEIIFSYPDLNSTELTYPGSEKTDSNGETYFSPDLDAAVTLFKDYR